MNVTRREFVRAGTGLAGAAVATAAAGTLAAPAPATRAADAPARIRAGFLGVAYSHAAEKIRLLRESPDFELVGVWAETPALRDTYAAQGVPTADAEAILARSEVIVVESAVPTHAALARRALEAGRHVHLEKPPALALPEFAALAALARERGLRLQVGYMWRHHPGLRAAFEAVRSGWLGDVFLVRAQINNTLAGERRAEWAEFPGGVLFELGSHLVDAVVRLLGRPEKVTPILRTHGETRDTLADNNVVVFEYPRATALITSSTLQPNAGAHRSLEILGTRGTAVLRPLEPPALVLDLARAAGPYQAGSQAVSLPPYRRYAEEFVELARSIRTGQPLPVSPEEETRVQETLLRACGVLP